MLIPKSNEKMEFFTATFILMKDYLWIIYYVKHDCRYQLLMLCFIFSVPIRNVEAVLGGIAELPCDVTPEDVHDDVYLILWFKDEASKPMYRYKI